LPLFSRNEWAAYTFASSGKVLLQGIFPKQVNNHLVDLPSVQICADFVADFELT